MRLASLIPATIAMALAPIVANAEPYTALTVVSHAAPVVQATVAGIVVADLAAIAICAGKLSAGRGLAGGSAYLSGLRLGGPLAGLFGAAYGGLNMAIGLTNVGHPVPTSVLAPGYAEMMLLILMGLFSGAIAVIAHWAVEARIDRTVLGG